MNLYDTLEKLDVAQLRAVSAYVVGRHNHLTKGEAAPARGVCIEVAVPTHVHIPVPTPVFKRGDVVEFYSSKLRRQVRLVVDRINALTLGGHEEDKVTGKWRVPPGMCRHVEKAKLEVPVPRNAAIPGSVPTAAGAGRW